MERKQGDRALFTIEFTSSDEYTDEDDGIPFQAPEPRQKERARAEISQPVKVTTTKSRPPLDAQELTASTHEEEPEEHIDEEINEDVFMLQDSPTASPVRPAPQPVFTKKLVAIPKKILTSPTYVVMREKRGLGKSLLFTIREGKTEHFKAKAKKSAMSIWAVGKDMKTTNPDYSMIIGSDEKDFSLRKSSATSDEIMLIRYAPAKGPVDNARKICVFFNVVKDGSPTRLLSRNPKLNPDGKAQHDFGGKFAIDSIKNAILVGTVDGPPLVMIRKAGKDVLELDVKFPHEPIWIFAIGLSSFLSKAH